MGLWAPQEESVLDIQDGWFLLLPTLLILLCWEFLVCQVTRGVSLQFLEGELYIKASLDILL